MLGVVGIGASLLAIPILYCLREPDAWWQAKQLAATGAQVEALVAFRRCCELLSVVLGLKPSAETERLYADITSGARPRDAARPA